MKEPAKPPPRHSTPARRSSFFTRTADGAFFPGTTVQAKLKIGPVDDPFERQADQVADRVVRDVADAAPESVRRQPSEEEEEVLQPSREPDLQRQPEEEEEELQMQPAEEEEEILQPHREQLLQRQPEDEEGAEELVQAKAEFGVVQRDLSRRLDSTRGGGRPLPAGVGGKMEAALGADLGAVRIHTDDAASQMSSEIGANAFTRGHDVYFAGGKYAPETRAGQHLLAHELTHVIQQRGGQPAETVQADYAVAPRSPNAVARTLTTTEINQAITYNSRSIRRASEIRMLRDILGLSENPATVDADFIRAVVSYQALYNLTQDGKVGGRTRRRLSREVLAEARFLRFRGLGGLAAGVRLRSQIRSLINANNTTYATYRARIRSATALQRNVVLIDRATLRALRNRLAWNNFARCVQLLGLRAPSFASLIRRRVVRTALGAAWTASNPGINPPLVAQHEEGGWIYLNLITHRLSIRRAPRGAGASISLSSPPLVADNIVVGMFHTHPNLRTPGGPRWVAGPSPTDRRLDAADGVPDIVVGSANTNAATFTRFRSGPVRRRHLAGNRGLPGAAGGLAPQATEDGAYDER